MLRSCLIATLSLLLVAAMIHLPGCRAEPGIDRRFGTYYQHMGAPSHRVVEAARETIDNMELQLIDESTSGHRTRFQTRNAFDARITISVEPRGSESTRVGVRITGGSEGLSSEVFNQIRDRL